MKEFENHFLMCEITNANKTIERNQIYCLSRISESGVASVGGLIMEREQDGDTNCVFLS